ncbi:MAG: metallophosphoesterase [Candidatus Omnitrophota bacterium]
MKIKNISWNRMAVVLFCGMVIYSFLPLIPFWLMDGASLNDNNEKSSALLGENKGAYFSFIVWGDNHAGLIFNDAAALKEIWHMNREDRFRKAPIDFVISPGDITLDGKEAHFSAFKKLQKLIKYPVLAGYGNHDDKSLFRRFLGEGQFVFVNRNAYFIVLDNEKGEIKKSQFDWLKDQLLKGQKYTHTFVIMHKPPFDPYQEDWYNEDNSPWAYKFRKLCAENKVRMVFSGHRHMFKHENFGGVDYIVTGGGGMLEEIPEARGGYLHYVRVTVNHDYVTYEARRVSPPLWEFVAYYMWKEGVYWARNLYGSGYIFGRNTKIETLREKRLNEPGYWEEKP